MKKEVKNLELKKTNVSVLNNMIAIKGGNTVYYSEICDVTLPDEDKGGN